MTRRIYNQASANKIQYIEGRVDTPVTIYQDLQVIALREMFNDDNKFIEHLSNILNIKLQIVKKGEGK